VLVYAIAGSLTLIISLATMSYQSIKAARGNPVESLRNE
jgi:putative ABC transport system permease protein